MSGCSSTRSARQWMAEQRQPALPRAGCNSHIPAEQRQTPEGCRANRFLPPQGRPRGEEAPCRGSCQRRERLSPRPTPLQEPYPQRPPRGSHRSAPQRSARGPRDRTGRDGTGRRPPRSAEPLRPSGPPGPRARSLTVAPSQVAAPVQAEAAAVAVRGAEREPVARLEVGSARAAAGQRLSLVQLLALGRRRPAHGAAAPPAAPAPQRPGGGGGGGGDEEEEEKAPSRSGDRPPAQRRGGQRRGQGPAARPDGSAPPRLRRAAAAAVPPPLFGTARRSRGPRAAVRRGARHRCPCAGRGLGGWRD